ncbi:MAG TPA: hypothetical protein PLG90_13180 [Ignavibacteria bacterium]|nr:hypothetical protein [Ignavibacteria bacterium]
MKNIIFLLFTFLVHPFLHLIKRLKKTMLDWFSMFKNKVKTIIPVIGFVRTKSFNLIALRLILITIVCSSFLTTSSGCSTIPTWKGCVNVNDNEITKHIGTVIRVLTGNVIQSACLTINLAGIDINDFKPGDIFEITLVEGDGKLGEPDDNSIYKITKVSSGNSDKSSDPVLILPGSDIQIR